MIIGQDIVDKVDRMPEVEYYVYLDRIGGYLELVKNDLKKNGDCNCVQEDLDNFQGVYDYVLSGLSKFNVTNDEQRDKWFKFWKSWRGSIDNNTWNIIMDKLKNKEDISEYLSTKKWDDDCGCLGVAKKTLDPVIYKEFLLERMKNCVREGIIFKITTKDIDEKTVRIPGNITWNTLEQYIQEGEEKLINDCVNILKKEGLLTIEL